MGSPNAGPNPGSGAPSGLCLIGTGSGCGKTWHTVGLLRALTERGHTCVPFKPVAVVDPEDRTSRDPRPAPRAIHHHLVAAGIPYAPEYNPLTVVPDQVDSGWLYGAGERWGRVRLAGPDQVDFAAMPEPLYRRCAGLVMEGLAHCRRTATCVLVEGAGDGTLGGPPADLANVLAPIASEYPTVLVVRPTRARQSTVAGSWFALPERVRKRVRGVLVNDPDQTSSPVRSPLAGVDLVVVGRCELPEFTGTLVRQQERHRVLAEHVWRSAPWESWLGWVPADR